MTQASHEVGERERRGWLPFWYIIHPISFHIQSDLIMLMSICRMKSNSNPSWGLQAFNSLFIFYHSIKYMLVFGWVNSKNLISQFLKQYKKYMRKCIFLSGTGSAKTSYRCWEALAVERPQLVRSVINKDEESEEKSEFIWLFFRIVLINRWKSLLKR